MRPGAANGQSIATDGPGRRGEGPTNTNKNHQQPNSSLDSRLSAAWLAPNAKPGDEYKSEMKYFPPDIVNLNCGLMFQAKNQKSIISNGDENGVLSLLNHSM